MYAYFQQKHTTKPCIHITVTNNNIFTHHIRNKDNLTCGPKEN